MTKGIDLIELSKVERARKAERGGYAYGAPRFGTRAVRGELVPDEKEQETIRLILRQRQEGKTFSAIAKDLEVHGYKTKRGAKWSGSMVKKIVFNAERYLLGGG